MASLFDIKIPGADKKHDGDEKRTLRRLRLQEIISRQGKQIMYSRKRLIARKKTQPSPLKALIIKSSMHLISIL